MTLIFTFGSTLYEYDQCLLKTRGRHIAAFNDIRLP